MLGPLDIEWLQLKDELNTKWVLLWKKVAAKTKPEPVNIARDSFVGSS
jgi:hypothetical protein